MLLFLATKKVLAKQGWTSDQKRNLAHRNTIQSSIPQATPVDSSVQILRLQNILENGLPIPPAVGVD